MGQKKNADHEVFECPVGRFFSELERCGGRKSKFREHLIRSRMEFLKAIRSLVDERLETLEKRGESCEKERVTKIVVE